MEYITILIAFVSCMVALLTFIDRKDRRKSDTIASNQKVFDKLDNINNIVEDIKANVQDIRNEVKEHSDRITRLEEWRRMKEGE